MGRSVGFLWQIRSGSREKRERRIGAFTQYIFISGERPFKRKWQYGSTNGFLEYEAQRPTKYSIKRKVSSKL
jgi:hypothetical protein